MKASPIKPERRDKILARLRSFINTTEDPLSKLYAIVAKEFKMNAHTLKGLAYRNPERAGLPKVNSPRVSEEKKGQIKELLALGGKWNAIATELKVTYDQVSYLARSKVKNKATQKKRRRYTASAAQSSANTQ